MFHHAWGANYYGQLGLGYTSEQECEPSLVKTTNIFKKIVGGGGHTVALDAGGKLFVCGWNRFGQLGLGHKQDVSVFTRTGVCDAQDIAAGWDFSLVLLKDGTVLSSGSNKFLQLGFKSETESESTSFVEISGLNKICQISAGLRHAAAVTQTGEVYSWGSGSKGQLGRGWRDLRDSGPAKLDLDEEIDRVHCAQYFTLLQTRSGDLYGFGDNKYGQTGSGDTAGKPVLSPTKLSLRGVDWVSCGWTHVVALLQGGRCYASWGRNNYAQLGRGYLSAHEAVDKEQGATLGDSSRPVKVLAGSEHCLALDECGHVYAWGWNEHGNCGVPDQTNVIRPTRVQFPDSNRICDIFVGSAHCFVLSE